MPAIGIDLGTTYSCVAVWQHNRVEVIANDSGNRTTPSYVAFTEEERLIGESAKSQVALNPSNTVFDAKRLIGRPFDDPSIQEDMKHWPFRVFADGSKPKIEIEYKRERKQFFAQEISSMVLLKMKETAEAYLGTAVTDAVITVPAYFNTSQRQATQDAGRIAGLNVLRIISEPNAAALAYGLNENIEIEKKILIFDLGGGTFDVSVLKISKKVMFEVLSTSGNTHLGGEDFDNILVNYLKVEFKKKSGIDIGDNPRAVRRLRTAAEQAKRELSATTEAYINIDSVVSGVDFHTRISRAKFETLCHTLFQSTLDPVQKAISDAKLTKVDIDEVVLVGGSTRIPKIRQLLQNYFDGKRLNMSVNPDEAVAYGAAVQAVNITGETSKSIFQQIVLLDVTPLSLGILTSGNVMEKIIERNTRIPCERSKTFKTAADFQTQVDISIYEGERLVATKNNFLGKFNVRNIPNMWRGQQSVLVIFKLDDSGLLNVTAKILSTGKVFGITLTNDAGRHSKEAVDKMVIDAAKFKEEDEMHGIAVKARRSLEDYAYLVKHRMSTARYLISEVDKNICRQHCNRVLSWIRNNTNTAHKEEYEYKLQELKERCAPYVDMLEEGPRRGKAGGRRNRDCN